MLVKQGFEGVFVHPSLDAPALDCGGTRLLDEISALLASLPRYSREREDLATALLGTGEILRFDTEGRMTLGDRLRDSVGLRDEAVFVGQGEKFQIWEPVRFSAYLDQARARVLQLRAELSFRNAQGAPE